jgi:O-antigen ligase
MTAQAFDPSGADAPTPLLTAHVCAIFALIFPVGYLSNQGFPVLLLFGGALSLPALGLTRRPMAPVLLLLALVGWALVSLAWTRQVIDPRALTHFKDLQNLTGAKLVFELALGAAFVAAARRMNMRGASTALVVLSFALAALSALVLLDALLGTRIYIGLNTLIGDHWTPDKAGRNIARGVYVVVLLFWCAAARMMQARAYAVVALTAVCAIASSMVLHAAEATLAAFVLSALAFILVRAAGAAGVALLAAATTIYWLAAPFIVLGALKSGVMMALRPHVQLSWNQRLDIWAFASAKVTEKPWMGWGLDASRTFEAAIPVHTHDAALQIWLELGAVGALLAALFWMTMWAAVESMVRRDRRLGAVWAATAVAYLTIGAVSFGVWQEWWLTLGVLALVACTCLARARSLDAAASDRLATPRAALPLIARWAKAAPSRGSP